MAAKSAPVGLKKPEKSFLHAVPDAYTSKLNRFAVWTAFGKQPYSGAAHSANRLSSLNWWRPGRHESGWMARRNVRSDRYSGRPLPGSVPAPPSVVREFSGQAQIA